MLAHDGVQQLGQLGVTIEAIEGDGRHGFALVGDGKEARCTLAPRARMLRQASRGLAKVGGIPYI
jgi:hypothetical protein